MYRPEIDGLRAVAVLAVILFHADVPGFGGGYVGVDVFFVISGYLITSLIVAEREAGTFSLVRFYERRARRILPALLAVLCVVVVGTWFILLPIDAVNVYGSILAALGMVSNVLFWRESGYFDTAAELKPLLHTWSLAVEEQFYLLYPLGVLGLLRMGRRWFALVLGVVAVASLAARGGWWVAGTDPDAAFFLLPMRAWELLVGCLLAWFLPNHRREWQQTVWHWKCRQIGSLVGLAFVAVPIAVYTESMQAAVYLMASVLGAALVIAFATPETIVGRLLGSRPAVGVGLISYSAYMIHEPLFVAVRMLKSAPPSLSELLLASGVTLLLAWASWRFVEQPFRHSAMVSARVFYIAMGAGVLVLAVIAGIGYGSNGFERAYRSMLPERVLPTFDRLGKIPEFVTGECRFGINDESNRHALDVRLADCAERYGKAVIVLGDSHANNLYNAIALNSEYPFLIRAGQGGCQASRDVDGCQYALFSDLVVDHAQQIGRVIYTQAGVWLIQGQSGKGVGNRGLFRRRVIGVYQAHQPSIERTEKYLTELSAHVPVVWLGSYVEPHLTILPLFRHAHNCELGISEVHPNTIRTFEELDVTLKKKLAEQTKVVYISAVDALQFDPYKDLYDCDDVFWRDGDHWSLAGQVRFGKRLLAAHPELVGEEVDSDSGLCQRLRLSSCP